MYPARDDVRDWVQRNRSDRLTSLYENGRNMGKAGSVPLAALGFWIAGAARGSAYDRETALILMESLAYASSIAGIGQRVVATERPEDGDRIALWGKDGHSVSGDVTIAASMLAPIAGRHLVVRGDDGPGKRFWKRAGAIGLYGAAGLTAMQRMDKDRHWLPDVYFGYVNGLAVGRLLVEAHRHDGEDASAGARRRCDVSLGPGGLRVSWPPAGR